MAALVVLAAAAEEPVRRAVAATSPGRVAIVLDRDVYERARPDLGDLRVVDDQGAQVPFLLERMGERPADVRHVRLLDRGFVRGESATVTLDFGGPARARELALSLAGDNFRRRVAVDGRGAADSSWTTLTDTAYVFAVPGPPAARYETVRLPDNSFERLRVTVFHGPDDPPVLEIRDVVARPARDHPVDEVELKPGVRRTHDRQAGETVLALDLGARAQPVTAVVLDVATPRFLREVVVEAGREAPRRGDAPRWERIATGVVHRTEAGGGAHEDLRVDACARARTLRVRILDRDDTPLDLRAVTVRAPVERVVFEALAPRSYALEYGRPGRMAPSYDLARTVDAAAWRREAAPASLGAPERVSGERRAAWADRHPALLMSGLVAAVAALAALTWRALRAAA